MATFADRLKQIRHERGWTLEEMADAIGTSKQVLSRYERGERFPKITTMRQFAERLHLDAAWLLGYEINDNNYLPSQQWLMDKIAKADEKSLNKLKQLMELIDDEDNEN